MIYASSCSGLALSSVACLASRRCSLRFVSCFMSISILSWNTRGLNDRRKRCLVRSAVSKLFSAVICLQESKVDSVSCSFLRSCCGSNFDKCHFLPAMGASGGLITCWNSKRFSCSEVIVRTYSLTLFLTHLPSGKNFYLTNVYGPPSWDGKEAFCSELFSLKAVCLNRWVICGDFNCTKNQSERKGLPWSRKTMAMFSDLINNLEVIDLPMSNQSYTWSNMHLKPTLAKLDRFLVSTDWDLSFPLSKVIALPRHTSDHTPIFLSTGTKLAPRRFRIEKVWLSKDDFWANVPLWWSEVGSKRSVILTLTAKLRHCRVRIKEWCKTNFYSIEKSIKHLQEEIQKIDLLEEQQNLSENVQERRTNLKLQLQQVLEDEEIFWKTRSRQTWLKEGDRNTNIFMRWPTEGNALTP